jgi:BRCT domain type II-containing protein
MQEDEEDDDDDDGKPLSGKKVVVSGEFELISRKKLEELIEQLGGQKMSGVSSRTHYLIVGYKLEDGRAVTQGSKYANAKKHGTTILTEKQFEDLLKEKSGNPDFTLSIRKSLNGGTQVEKQQTLRRSIVSEEAGGEKNAMWTDVYRPTELDDLVGNEGVVD